MSRRFNASAPIRSGDRIVDEAQEGVSSLARELGDVPFLRGRAYYGLSFTAGVARTLQHGFGLKAGAMVLSGNLDGTGNVFRLTESATAFQLDPNNTISLVADANCKLDIWLWPRGAR